MSKRRCLVADDHPALGLALCTFLSAEGYDVVGPTHDGEAALAALAGDAAPDLGVIDYRMPRLWGATLLERLKAAAPSLRIAVYTAEADERLVGDALGAGADAVVLKEAPLDDLLRALETISAGRRYLDPTLASLALLTRGDGTVDLTAREREVLRLLAEGWAHEQIGGHLGIGAETVRTHLRKASDRLGAANRTQAVATALRLGLID
jgi:DNA-binding NarL/FixJ family response regulator